ncbi:MAG: TraB/GumN family protein [SAR324 cluster bacterium]|mgnify:FL=1|jgi:pheromone shutdown-related protein TraB|nr:TraB/GumN family protein [SAR324 cluster bacterium]MDG1487205.1 TraB/GumN family protein [SAR324 cluster bacterium]MDG2066663.1 TraB/GumN family protein [SAR324 cluster bacterium]
MTYSGNVHEILIDEKQILLIGTAHISQSSVDEVNDVIEQEKPDTVCIELCASRHQAMMDKDQWKNMDIFKVVREGKSFLLFANLIMTAFQKRLGSQLGVKPGAEMLAAAEASERVNSELLLADRDVKITLQRTWRGMPFWGRMKVLSQLLASLFIREEISKEEIEKLKESDALSEAMQMLADQSPDMKRILIDERDQFMAEKIRQAPGKRIVAVVGAGHVKGLTGELEREHNLAELETVPPPGKLGIWLKWGIPTLIVGLIGYGFFAVDTDVSIEMIQRWFLINGTLSAIGTAIAFGHPITIATAFVAAPFTSLNPAVAAGWVAGLVEAFLRKPQVRDFENLADDITHLRGFWQNNITRILLVVMFANLGSAIGTFAGGFAIASLL